MARLVKNSLQIGSHRRLRQRRENSGLGENLLVLVTGGTLARYPGFVLARFPIISLTGFCFIIASTMLRIGTTVGAANVVVGIFGIGVGEDFF